MTDQRSGLRTVPVEESGAGARDAVRQPPHWQPRAQRFPIETEFRYRVEGETGWRAGTTVNLSHSGLLFRVSQELKPRTVLEMKILFTAEMTGDTPASIHCWGPVARNDHFLTAAAIRHYRFEQG